MRGSGGAAGDSGQYYASSRGRWLRAGAVLGSGVVGPAATARCRTLDYQVQFSGGYVRRRPADSRGEARLSSLSAHGGNRTEPCREEGHLTMSTLQPGDRFPTLTVQP